MPPVTTVSSLPLGEAIRIPVDKTPALGIDLGPIPPHAKPGGDYKVKGFTIGPLERNSGPLELFVYVLDDGGNGVGLVGLEEEAVVVLEEKLDGKERRGTGSKGDKGKVEDRGKGKVPPERPSPTAVENKVKQLGHGRLWNKGYGLAKGGVFVRPIEENPSSV